MARILTDEQLYNRALPFVVDLWVRHRTTGSKNGFTALAMKHRLPIHFLASDVAPVFELEGSPTFEWTKVWIEGVYANQRLRTRKRRSDAKTAGSEPLFEEDPETDELYPSEALRRMDEKLDRIEANTEEIRDTLNAIWQAYHLDDE